MNETNETGKFIPYDGIRELPVGTIVVCKPMGDKPPRPRRCTTCAQYGFIKGTIPDQDKHKDDVAYQYYVAGMNCSEWNFPEDDTCQELVLVSPNDTDVPEEQKE